MVERREVEFEAEGGDRLRGWLFVPATGTAPRPAISMAHGHAGVKEHGLERFARAFAEAGFVVLLHDHRNFGSSDGAVRHDIDPWRQIADWRRAISFLESLPEADAGRIGVWGTSYAGGHAIVLAATDRRVRAGVRAVVAQVRPSAVTSRGCAAYRLTRPLRSSVCSMTMSARRFAVKRLVARRLSATMPRHPLPIGPGTPSRSISSRCRRASGRTR